MGRLQSIYSEMGAVSKVRDYVQITSRMVASLETLVRDLGGCDHGAGICMCEEKRAAEMYRESLQAGGGHLMAFMVGHYQGTMAMDVVRCFRDLHHYSYRASLALSLFLDGLSQDEAEQARQNLRTFIRECIENMQAHMFHLEIMPLALEGRKRWLKDPFPVRGINFRIHEGRISYTSLEDVVPKYEPLREITFKKEASRGR